MPRLSIVIPVLGDTAALESTLVSVLENRPHDCEIVVVLGHDYADPYDLKNEVRFVDAPRGASLVKCANLGVTASHSPIVHLLAAGCEVGEGWADAAIERFADQRVASVAPLVYRLHDPERIAAAGIGYRRGGGRKLNQRVSPANRVSAAVLGAPSFAGFFRKKVWETVGGFSGEVGDELADIDLACTLRRAGHLTALEPRSCVWARNEVLTASRGYRAGLHAERLFWRNSPSVGWTTSIVSHTVGVMAELASSFPRPSMLTQLAGRVVGCCKMNAGARHHQEVEQLTDGPTILRAHGDSQLRVDNSHGAARQSKDGPARVKAG